MYQTKLLRDEHVEPLAEGVYEVLERVGLLCQNQELLQALAKLGAKVDYQTERAWFPTKMTREFVDGLRKEYSGRPLADPAFQAPGLPGFGCQIAQIYYDYRKPERRGGNSRDFIEMIKLADVLHPNSPAGHCLVPTEFPGRIEALESAMLMAEYAHRPDAAFAWFVEQVDYLKEMGEILGIPNWFHWGALCFAHPLRFDKDVADKFVRRAKEGVSAGLTAMPIAGCSTPATVEGFIVVSTAEHVATWLSARALNPKVGLGGSMWAGTVDMATGRVSYSAFDAMYYAFASVEFVRRWIGIEVVVGGGEYCDAREPGMFAVCEKAYKAMTIAAFTGRHPGIGSGMLECGKVMAPVQLMIERDFSQGAGHFARKLNPTRDIIGMDPICEVGLCLEQNHLMTEHTVNHFRTSLWLPQFIERSGWRGADGDKAMLDKAQAQIDDMLSQYRKPEGREEKLAKMRAVVERAKRKLL